MIRRKGKHLTAAGTLALVIGLGLHNWTHGSYAHFASGFLLGLSIVFMLGGLARQH